MLCRKVRRCFFQKRDVFGLLGDLRSESYQLSAFIGQKLSATIRVWPTTGTGGDHAPSFIGDPLMQQVFVQIQLTGNVGHPPIAVDHTMGGFNLVLGGKRSPRS